MYEKTYSKVELAKTQLNKAIALFLSEHDFVCALTLAGAAEEILGRSLQARGDKNSLQSKYEALKPVRDMFGSDQKGWQHFANEENYAKNSVKHMSDDSEMVSLDLEAAACWMIVRACDNYERLGFERTPLMLEFEDWFHRNIVGLDEEVGIGDY